MKKGCLFDLDGTLVDSIEDLALSTNEVLKKHHLPLHEITCYKQFVGNGVKKLVERALGEEHQDLLDECLKEFYEVYEEHCLDHTKPYPHMQSLIDCLYDEGIQLAVVTNKPHHLAVRIVEHCFPNQFITILGQQDLYPTKPNPQSTHLALMSMRLGSKDCYFIGDSNVDIETGYQANVETIGVTWGFRGRDELEEAGADFVVESPDEIKELIFHDRG